MIKIQRKLNKEDTYFNIIKAIQNTCLDIILTNRWKQKKFPWKPWRNRKRASTPTCPTYYRTWSFIQRTQSRRKKMKGLKIEKKEVMLSLFGTDNLLYPGEPKYSTRRLLKVMNKSRKPAGHRINLQNSVTGVGKGAQWAKILSAKSEDLGSVSHKLSSDLHTCVTAHTHK